MRERNGKPNTRYNIQWWIFLFRWTAMNIQWMQAMLSLNPNPILSVGLDGLGGWTHNIYWGKGMVHLTPDIIFSDRLVWLGRQEWILYLILGWPFPSHNEYYVSFHLILPSPTLNIGSVIRLSTACFKWIFIPVPQKSFNIRPGIGLMTAFCQ